MLIGYFTEAQLTDSLERQIFSSDKRYVEQKKLLHESLDSFFMLIWIKLFYLPIGEYP